MDDDNEYEAIRSQLLQQPTSVEQQVLSRIATMTDLPQNDEKKGESKWDRCLIVHYNHEQRLAGFRRDVHRLWDAAFHKTPVQNTRLIVGNRNNRNTKRELIHNRPAKKHAG